MLSKLILNNEYHYHAKCKILNLRKPLSLNVYPLIIGFEIGEIGLGLASELNAMKEVMWDW